MSWKKTQKAKTKKEINNNKNATSC